MPILCNCNGTLTWFNVNLVMVVEYCFVIEKLYINVVKTIFINWIWAVLFQQITKQVIAKKMSFFLERIYKIFCVNLSSSGSYILWSIFNNMLVCQILSWYSAVFMLLAWIALLVDDIIPPKQILTSIDSSWSKMFTFEFDDEPYNVHP